MKRVDGDETKEEDKINFVEFEGELPQYEIEEGETEGFNEEGQYGYMNLVDAAAVTEAILGLEIWGV